MNFHGNSLQNGERHHLYEIVDSEDETVFKYGIYDNPIEADGISKRIREQLELGNLYAGWDRYFARILLTGIEDRERALEIEDEHIKAFRKKHGRKPRGNRRERKPKN